MILQSITECVSLTVQLREPHRLGRDTWEADAVTADLGSVATLTNRS